MLANDVSVPHLMVSLPSQFGLDHARQSRVVKLTKAKTASVCRLAIIPVEPEAETRYIVMAALRSRCGHYIFALWFLSFFFFFLFSSFNFSGHGVDVYHTSTHGVALVPI